MGALFYVRMSGLYMSAEELFYIRSGKNPPFCFGALSCHLLMFQITKIWDPQLFCAFL